MYKGGFTMKKLVGGFLASVMMCSSVFAGDISVSLNGENVEFATQSPVIVEGRTLIPLRGVFEQLGYEISWDNESKTATFVKDETTVKVSVNSKSFTVNDSDVALDVPAQIVNGSMMLPLRAIGEATGLDVDWDGESKTVFLGSSAPTTEATTETTTETTTEKATETTTIASNGKLTDAEYEKIANEYIEFNKASAYAVAYSGMILPLIANTQESDLNNINFDLGIELNDKLGEMAKALNKNKYNEDIINKLNVCVDKTDNLFAGYKYYVDNGLFSSYSAQQDMEARISSFVDAFEELMDVCESSSEKYLESIEGVDWDEDDLTSAQVKEVRAFQKKVGEIIDNAFNNANFDEKDSYSTYVSKMNKISDEIKNGVSKLTPPDFAMADKNIMLKGCDILDEIAVLCKDSELVEGTAASVKVDSLIIVFESCAKTCAGDYYVAEVITNK